MPEGWIKGRKVKKEWKRCKRCSTVITHTGKMCERCRYKQSDTNHIPNKYHSLKGFIKQTLKIDNPTWDHYFIIRKIIKNKIAKGMSPNELKNYYNISYTEFGMFLKKTLNLELG